MKKLLSVLLLPAVLTACVSNKAVDRTTMYDTRLTCEEITQQIAQMQELKREFNDESGVTGKNVALALVFWPGIIFNEAHAHKNAQSVSERIDVLNGLYQNKCTATVADTGSNAA